GKAGGEFAEVTLSCTSEAMTANMVSDRFGSRNCKTDSTVRKKEEDRTLLFRCFIPPTLPYLLHHKHIHADTLTVWIMMPAHASCQHIFDQYNTTSPPSTLPRSSFCLWVEREGRLLAGC